MKTATECLAEFFGAEAVEEMFDARIAREAEGWSLDRSHQAARMYWGPSSLPHGSHFEGTIRRPDGRTGALIQINHTGVYVQGNAGMVTTLDQDAIRDILGR
jgi:hypothetical protein